MCEIPLVTKAYLVEEELVLFLSERPFDRGPSLVLVSRIPGDEVLHVHCGVASIRERPVRDPRTYSILPVPFNKIDSQWKVMFSPRTTR